ncbi:MAG TPA: RNA polymerase sigma factor [Kofleriaceae bacterium]|nr:RNA polymerase sigma factor [Kofleriaceae bacterium]
MRALVGQGKQDQAIALLMKSHGAHLHRFAVRMLRDPEAAKEVCQRVFFEAFQGLPEFRGEGSLLSWLFGIAKHRCIDEIRRRKRAVDTDDLTNAEHRPELAVSASEPDFALEHNLRHCLDELPPEIRSAVLLRYLGGLTHVEIGEATQVAAGTIQVQISRALIKLRKCLRHRGISER